MDDKAELLIGVGLQDRGSLMGYRGWHVWLLFDDGGLMDAKDVMPAADYPCKPGVYVWRGRIVVDGGGVWEDLSIGCKDGEWSLADQGDLDNLLGVQIPPPPEPEEEREKIQEGDYHYYRPEGSTQ